MEVIRKGPWTAEEDSLLFDYVNIHGEGHWNSVARYAGLKRAGKSCRLRWLNYLRPNVRRGNITLQEQLLILQLHSRWGNRWSKIAQHLPGRTDNEIKNYWRTRVQKQAKQQNCDVNSQQFRDTMRYVWIPRLMERIRASSSEPFMGGGELTSTTTPDLNPTNAVFCNNNVQLQPANICMSGSHEPKHMPEISSGCSLHSLNTQKTDPVDCHSVSEQSSMQDGSCVDNTWTSCWGDMHSFESDVHAFGFEQAGIWSESNCGDSFMDYCLWNGDNSNNQDTLLLQQHLYCD